MTTSPAMNLLGALLASHVQTNYAIQEAANTSVYRFSVPVSNSINGRTNRRTEHSRACKCTIYEQTCTVRTTDQNTLF